MSPSSQPQAKVQEGMHNKKEKAACLRPNSTLWVFDQDALFSFLLYEK